MTNVYGLLGAMAAIAVAAGVVSTTSPNPASFVVPNGGSPQVSIPAESLPAPPAGSPIPAPSPDAPVVPAQVPATELPHASGSPPIPDSPAYTPTPVDSPTTNPPTDVLPTHPPPPTDEPDNPCPIGLVIDPILGVCVAI